MTPATAGSWLICVLATAGVIGRPWRLPEWVWAVAGAGLLVLLGLVPARAAAGAAIKGTDVYLFLAGMMLLSETARAHGLFGWVAAVAVDAARGSAARLFLLVYVVGVVVTAFLSNDATAVVLTPAVFAAAKRADADPLPLLFACALVANAASFALPISNPANLVLYGGHMPALGAWLGSFGLPSLAAILVTFAALRWIERDRLNGDCARDVHREPLSRGGRVALAGIVVTAVTLLGASVLGAELGLPTAIAGVATALITSGLARRGPLELGRDVSWGVLPLVAGLFVLVEALDRSGVVAAVASLLAGAAGAAPAGAAAGVVLAVASNLMNNLPAGLIVADAIRLAHAPRPMVDCLLIGVDLGPNLSVSGSLATILWLQAIRREGEDVSFGRFLSIGAIAMPAALFAALGSRILV